MNERPQIYLYGMTLITTSHRLRDRFPKPDDYSEIAESHSFPGGETGSCAIVLASLGCDIRLDGIHLGRKTWGPITEYFRGTPVDTSLMTYDDGFDGLEDMVILDSHTRNGFGMFERFHTEGGPRWNRPSREAITACRAAGVDPYFAGQSDEAAQLCRELGKPFVTIDCKYDSEPHRLCSVNVLAGEFLRGAYPDADREELFARYTEHTDGLTIFTSGTGDILFGRRGQPIQRFQPYRVDVVSTLGAGDTFKAGTVYALAQGMSDPDIVRFAAASAAVACTGYPLALHPPTLARVEELLATR